MSYKIPLFNRSIIKSDEGFKVIFVSRDILRYDDKELIVMIGFDTGGDVISLMCKTLTQLAPHAGKELTPTQKKRVLDNIVDALTWRKFIVDFIS